MEYTIREIIQKTGRNLDQTAYVDSNPEMLDFRLISGEHYSWENNKLRFKESVAVMDFEQTVKEFPALAAVKYKSRKKFLYFTDNLSLLVEAMKSGETVAVEGGPCLFGAYEVSVFVYTDDGKKINLIMRTVKFILMTPVFQMKILWRNLFCVTDFT